MIQIESGGVKHLTPFAGVLGNLLPREPKICIFETSDPVFQGG